MNIRTKLRRSAVAAGLATLLVALGACSSGSSESKGGGEGSGLPEVAAPEDVIEQTVESLEGKKVQMIVVTDAQALTVAWIDRIRAGLEQNGIDFKTASANFDTQVLAQQVQTAINEDPDLLIIQNSDATGLANLLKEAQDKGIYVLTMNLASNTQTDAYIGANWDDLGYQLANRAADDCEGQGKQDVGVITGFGADTNSVLFATGAERAFEERGMNVVATQPGQFDPGKAGNIARTVLQQNPDVCAFVGSWDVMMGGVAKVVKDGGLQEQVGVYTTDNTAPTCDLIKDGSMRAALDQGAGTTMGDMAVAMSLHLLQSGREAGAARTALYVPTRFIDKSNVDEPGACYGAPNAN